MRKATLLPLLLLATSSQAANVLYQNDPSGDTFAFEAESFNTVISADGNWSQLVNATTDPILSGASGSAAIWVSGLTADGLENAGAGNPSVPTKAGDRRYEYELFFTSPGTYNFHVRGYEPESSNATDAAFSEGRPRANNDSFFPMDTFGGDPSLAGNYGAGTQSFGHAAGGASAYDWRNHGVTITVAPGQVGTPITWAWTMREDGPLIDRFVFTKLSGATDAQLDALMNVPEPGRAGLLALGLGLGLLRRRR